MLWQTKLAYILAHIGVPALISELNYPPSTSVLGDKKPHVIYMQSPGR